MRSTSAALTRASADDVGAADVAVALRPHQRGQRLHQVQHVGVDRGPLVERAEQRRGRLGQVGLEAGLQHPGQHRQRGLGRTGRAPGPRSRRRRWCPTRRPRRRRHGELRLPLQAPGLAEGAGAAHVAGRRARPVDAEQPQPVEQRGAPVVEGAAQVEVEGAGVRLALQLRGAAGAQQVGLQRHRRDVVGDRPEPLPHDQVVGHEPGRERVALAEHRPGGLVDLRQPGERPAAEPGEVVGQPDRVDDVGGGDGQVALAQRVRDPGQPAGDRLVGGGPQVVVPAGRGHPGAVPGRGRQPRVRPRHPGQRHLPLRDPPQRAGVGRSRWAASRTARARARRRRPPPPARGPCFRVARSTCRIHASRSTSCGSSLCDGSSSRSAAIASVSAGNGDAPSSRDSMTSSHQRSASSYPAADGQGRQRVPAYDGRSARSRPSASVARRGQVAERDVHAGPDRPGHRLPLRGEHRVGPERRHAGVVGGVGQHRDRRLHARRGADRQQRVGVGRALDQHGVGGEVRQRAQQRARRPGAVVADAEDLDGHPDSSRQAV